MDLNSNILIVLITVAALGIGFWLAGNLTGVIRWISSRIRRVLELADRRTLDEMLPDAMIRVDKRGTIRWINAAAEALFGYERDEVRGQPIFNMVRGVTAFGCGPRVGKNSALSRLHSSVGIETEAIRKDGSTFPVRCVALEPFSLLLGRARVIVKDETDRAQRLELQTRSELLDATIQGLDAPVLLVDHAKRVVFANRASDRLFGSMKATGCSLEDLFQESNSRMNDGEARPGMRLVHARTGYVFTVRSEVNVLGQEYTLLSGARKGELFEVERYGAYVLRFDDLLTKINGCSESLLANTDSSQPIRDDLEQVHDASREAVAILRVFRRT